jgi:proline-specific peptidase
MAERMVEVPGGRVWTEVTGDGRGIPLLLLHGGPGIPSYYLDSLRDLGAERPVILYDQLGCGRSEHPSSPEQYQAERFVQEVGDVRSALGLQRVHVLGQSWGGMLAVMYALTAPRGLVSLVLASPVIDTQRWVADCSKLKAELPAEVRDVIDDHEARGYQGCPEYAAANLDWWRRHVCRMRPFPESLEKALQGMNAECYEIMWGPSEFTCTGNLHDVELSARLPEITSPVLFTCGRHDEARPESTRHFASLIAGAETEVFQESSHMAHLEESDRFLRRVSRFLTETDAQQP